MSRAEYYRRLGERNAAPLWESLGGLVTPQPRPKAVPVIWRYSEMRDLLMEAGSLITAREAERRVLVLENPAIKGASKATDSLYAGIQLVLPGEKADSHRHSAAALRLVLESDGGYTAVNSEKVTMSRGDFIITPSWTDHEHGNPGSSPAIWLDVLDMHLVNFLGCSFAEHSESGTRPDSHPVFSYPYDRARKTLDELQRNKSAHPSHGVKMRYVNPETGGWPMPTIGTFLQLLPAGFAGIPSRSTDSTVYCVVEGRGETRVGEETFDWEPNDVFVVPSWMPVSHKAEREAVLFSASDRPVQEAFGLFRESV